MGPSELLNELERRAVVGRVHTWVESLVSSGGLVSYEEIPATTLDERDRWLLRFPGEDRDIIALWLTLDQRTVHYESQFMPALEAHEAEVLTYLMKVNAQLAGLSFAIGPEDAIYLLGRTPARDLDDTVLDAIAGAVLSSSNQHFATAMSLAFPGRYRRRKG